MSLSFIVFRNFLVFQWARKKKGRALFVGKKTKRCLRKPTLPWTGRPFQTSRSSLSYPKYNMAESDEDVDVEDVSDGEQTTNLQGLGEDDHKDKWYGNVLGFICNKLVH